MAAPSFPTSAIPPSTPPVVRAGPLLALDGVTRAFGGLVAVDHVSFTVEQGQI